MHKSQFQDVRWQILHKEPASLSYTKTPRACLTQRPRELVLHKDPASLSYTQRPHELVLHKDPASLSYTKSPRACLTQRPCELVFSQMQLFVYCSCDLKQPLRPKMRMTRKMDQKRLDRINNRNNLLVRAKEILPMTRIMQGVVMRWHGSCREWWWDDTDHAGSGDEMTRTMQGVVMRWHGPCREWWWDDMEHAGSGNEMTWNMQGVVMRWHGPCREWWWDV